MDELESYPTEAKLTFCTNMGSVILMLAFVICWLCGEDPLGACCSIACAWLLLRDTAKVHGAAHAAVPGR